MSKFNISLKTAHDVMHRIFASLNNSIKAFNQLHYTVQSFRPAGEEQSFSLQVIMNLLGGAASFGAARTLLKQTYRVFASKGVDENKWKQFGDFWKDVSSKLEDNKNHVVRSVMELMRREIAHMWHIGGFFSLSQMYPSKKLIVGSEQYQKMQEVWSYNYYQGTLTAVSYLFLELKPHLLSPQLFFSSADGLYYYISQFFEKVIEKGDGEDNLVLYKMAISFVRLGIIVGPLCPDSKLECPDANRAKINAQKRARRKLDQREQLEVYVLSKLKVVRKRFERNSLVIATKLMNKVSVRFFKGSYVLQLAGQLLQEAIKKMKPLYIEMRRIVYYNLLRIFPIKELKDEIQKLLWYTTESYFTDCIELFRRCKEVMRRITARYANVEFETRLAFDQVYNPYRSLSSVLPDKCKDAVVDYVRYCYTGLRRFLFRLIAEYIFKYATNCGGIGLNPMSYRDSKFAFLRFLQTYKNIRDELDDAIAECQDGTLVVLKDWNKISTLPHQTICHAWQMMPNIYGHPPIDKKVIARQFPLDKELRDHIADLHLGPIFDGSEPKMEQYVKSYPHTRILRSSTVNIRFYVPPKYDLLSKQELWTFFN